MKKISCFIISFLFAIVQAQKINITFSKNIETYFLAEILAADYRETNKEFELFKKKECSVYQPIVKKAIIEYDNPKNEKIARLTAEINDTFLKKYGFGNDVLMESLLTHEEFPSKKWKTDYHFTSNDHSAEQNNEITELIIKYVDELADFYKAENIDRFFKENRSFYKSAEKEFDQQIPKGFAKAMEKYYGEKFNSYTVLLSPVMMWPIDDGEGRGIGAKTEVGNKVDIYEIASPFVRVTQPDQYGYDNQFQARFLTVHEFGHSFVNKEVYKNKENIDRFKTLFEESKLKETMIKTGGYGDYQTCVAEHLVRLGEIEIALLQNDQERANKLLAYHLKNNFIFLPQLLGKIKEYNNDRKKYPSFRMFVPKLLEIFDDSNIAFINEKLDKK